MPPDLEKAPVGPGCQFVPLAMDRGTGGIGEVYSRRVFSWKEDDRRMLDGGKEGTMSDLGGDHSSAQRRGGG